MVAGARTFANIISDSRTAGRTPHQIATNIVDVHVARLRGKLKRHPAVPEIETVRGFGFRLATEPAGA
jgi:DNA-binding response OmpR family regulator